jgi:hypothetical protein
MTFALLVGASLATVLGLHGSRSFQPAGTAQPNPTTAAPAPPPGVPPQVRLGQRVEAVRRNVGVIPTLMIVPDGASYVAAIRAWRMQTPPPNPPAPAFDPNDPVAPPPPPPPLVGTYFPVLIDDGSFQSREDIARFVRAFKPLRIMRVKAAVPGAKAPTRSEVEAAFAIAWDAKVPGGTPAAPALGPSATMTALNEKWKSIQYVPPGVVVAADADGAAGMDPAWTAALALATGHGQPIVWITPPPFGGGASKARPARDVDERYSLEQVDTLSTLIEASCTATGYAWTIVGDDIEAVTLCLNTPAAANTPPGDKREMLAVTDLIGRSRDDARKRWAWSGQIFGTEARAAYAAMCSLFLQPKGAWFFDGYENAGPYAAFDATAAGDMFSKAKYECIVDDTGSQSDDAWRRRIAGAPEKLRDEPVTKAGGIGTGLIAVNTSGYADFFDLQPGQCKTTDVPLLRVPSIVHFVHSWSAHQPGVRTTIAGRFLANGAYVYVGSVHEPYLAAFVPTPLLIQRLLALAPIGISARLDDAEAWKVAMIGDPLWTLGPEAPRRELIMNIEGAEDLSVLLTKSLEAKDADAAIALLSLLGRDTEAASLAVARVNEAGAGMKAEAALVGALSVFRSEWPVRGVDPKGPPRHAMIAKLVKAAGDAVQKAPEVRDALWHSVYPSLGSLPDDVIEVLKANVRQEQLPRDAIDLSTAIRRVSGDAAAKNYLRGVREGVTHEPWKKELDRAISGKGK